jgi:hypothetical protein
MTAFAPLSQVLQTRNRDRKGAGGPIRLLLLLLAALPSFADPLLFVYFREPANMGVFFATSPDGYHWTEKNSGKPWLPVQYPGELMRDPFITRGPDGEFHLVWTLAWRGASIGYAHSPDLVHWSKPRCAAMGETGLKIDPSCQEAHISNFLDCIRTRKRPVADVEIGYRSVSACLTGVIAYRLGRKVRWDAKGETFPNDREAQAMMTKQYRAPWALPRV